MKKRIWLIVFAVSLALSFMADLLPQREEAEVVFWWSDIWGFFAFFGFISCVAIIVIAKLLSHYWLQRKEDYYEEGSKEDEHNK